MKKLTALAIVAFIASYTIYDSFSVAKMAPKTKPKRVSIMTYNVENLFDTKDDPSKNDETFLPLAKKNKTVQKKCKKSGRKHWIKECLSTNWTPFKLNLKMKRLSKVIKAYSADVLILQEIENLEVLKAFNKKYLGYPNVILLEGPDKRGIDVAILSKLKNVKRPQIHLQKFKKKKRFGKIKPTRGILEATLELPDGKPLTVFGVHFPSQGSPTSARSQAIDRLNGLLKKRSGLVIAGGDFNITKSEDKKHKLYKKKLSNKWQVSHLIGCKKCKGSNYYHRKRSWSFLDALLFSKSFNKKNDSKKWKVDFKSIDIFKKLPVQKNRHGFPAKFKMGQNRSGVSDHWPVVAEIYL